MSSKTKSTMNDVICFLDNDKQLCSLKWDEIPNTGMSFYYKKKEYVIIKIDGSKITVKDITKYGAKNK